MKQRRSTLIAVTTAIGLALLTACGGAGGQAAGTAGTAGAPVAVPGFDGTTIRVGTLGPLSGPVAVIGLPVTAGQKVWFDQVNSEGGIAGRYPIEMVQEDTQYQPDLTVQQYQKIKDDVVGFAQVLGTPSTLAVLPLMQADGTLGAPLSLDALWIREPNLLPVAAPYQVQAINAVDWYLSDAGGTPADPVCTMIQDDAFGETALDGVETIAASRGFPIATTQRFRAGTADHTGAIQALAGAGCRFVYLAATPGDAAKIWGAAAQADLQTTWVAQSPAWTTAFAQAPFAAYLQEHVHVANDGTEWGDQAVPGMVEMVEQVQRFAPDQAPDYYVANGYNSARAFTAVLEKAVENGDLSRPGLLAAAEEITVDFEGMTGEFTYGPAEQRDPPRTTSIFGVDPARPTGLATESYNRTSPEAEDFAFEKADI